MNNKQIQYCKSVIRGQAAGDRMVAMIALQQNGLKVPDAVMKDIRKSETADESLLRRAYDVYRVYVSFIERDRHDKYSDSDLYAHKLVESVNLFNGKAVCTVSVLASHMSFVTKQQEFKFIRGRYDEKRAKELYALLAAACTESEVLMRVFKALEVPADK